MTAIGTLRSSMPPFHGQRLMFPFVFSLLPPRVDCFAVALDVVMYLQPSGCRSARMSCPLARGAVTQREIVGIETPTFSASIGVVDRRRESAGEPLPVDVRSQGNAQMAFPMVLLVAV